MADMRTVGELMNYLATQPPDRKIVLQKDAEGNGYSPLTRAREGMYAADSTWSGELYQTPEVIAAEPGEWSDAPDDAERVIVFVPVN
jgi:hypothetical protein